MKFSFAVLALAAAQEAGDLVGTKGVAGGTQYVNNRSPASQKRSPLKIWDGDHTSWFRHDGWEPTRSNHKWSAAKLEYTTSISKFCVAPRPEGARFARSRGPVELNGYSLFGALKKPTLRNGDERLVKLNQWTKLATIRGISGKTGSIRSPYKVQKNRRDIHGKECVEIPVTNTDQFNYVMIYHTTRAQTGNGDVLAVEVYAGAQPVPAEPIVLQVGGANDDGVKDHDKDHFNQQTLTPTKRPTVGFNDYKNPESKGNLDAQVDQTDRVHQPTARPTSYPTKDTADANGKGSACKFGSFTRPVGWVGAGPNQYYCNVWRCESNTDKFTRTQTAVFKAARRTCSIEQYNYKFCSHTTCELVDVTVKGNKRQVIRVHSDHRETVGGEHKCGFARHAAAQTSGRPACDCVCHGDRKQDAAGFTRGLNEFGTFTATSREAINSNNFYSQHNNLDYNEKDQSYTGQRIAHAHRNE